MALNERDGIKHTIRCAFQMIFLFQMKKKRAATKCGYKTKQSTYTLIHKREESAYQAEHSERIYT